MVSHRVIEFVSLCDSTHWIYFNQRAADRHTKTSQPIKFWLLHVIKSQLILAIMMMKRSFLFGLIRKIVLVNTWNSFWWLFPFSHSYTICWPLQFRTLNFVQTVCCWDANQTFSTNKNLAAANYKITTKFSDYDDKTLIPNWFDPVGCAARQSFCECTQS